MLHYIMCGHKVCVKTGAAPKVFNTDCKSMQCGFGMSSNGEIVVLSFIKIGRLVQKVGDLKRLLMSI